MTRPDSHGDCTAAIIAGGPASRFNGRDKSALLVGGQSILDRQLAALTAVTDRIVIVASDGARFASRGLAVVPDLLEHAAALGAVYTALAQAATPRVLVLACDMPFLTAPFLEFLVEAGTGADLTIPHPPDGYQPLCAVYGRPCLEPIRERVSSRQLRVQDLVAEVRSREIGPTDLAPFDPDGALFFNVNTPEDYERAQRLALQLDGRRAS